MNSSHRFEHTTPTLIKCWGLGKPISLYHLRHACATLLLERGLSHADVAVQLGHTDGGALVMSTYGHPSEARALDRIRLMDAHRPTQPLSANQRRTDTGNAA